MKVLLVLSALVLSFQANAYEASAGSSLGLAVSSDGAPGQGTATTAAGTSLQVERQQAAAMYGEEASVCIMDGCDISGELKAYILGTGMGEEAVLQRLAEDADLL